jgi:hypothetical protein
MGHSSPLPALTLETMQADALTARTALAATTPDVPVAMLGARFGATVAARAADDTTRGLVVYEPVVDAGQALRELWRMRAAELVVRALHRNNVADELFRRGAVTVGGYRVARPTADSLATAGLDTVEPRWPLLAIGLRAGPQPSKKLAATAVGWRAAGFAVDLHQVDDPRPWWASGEADLVEERDGATLRVSELTATWLLALCGRA